MGQLRVYELNSGHKIADLKPGEVFEYLGESSSYYIVTHPVTDEYGCQCRALNLATGRPVGIGAEVRLRKLPDGMIFKVG